MGLFDFNTQDLSSETTLPGYVNEFSRSTIDATNDITNRDFPRADLTRPVLGPNAAQFDAFNMVRNTAGVGGGGYGAGGGMYEQQGIRDRFGETVYTNTPPETYDAAGRAVGALVGGGGGLSPRERQARAMGYQGEFGEDGYRDWWESWSPQRQQALQENHPLDQFKPGKARPSTGGGGRQRSGAGGGRAAGGGQQGGSAPQGGGATVYPGYQTLTEYDIRDVATQHGFSGQAGNGHMVRWWQEQSPEKQAQIEADAKALDQQRVSSGQGQMWRAPLDQARGLFMDAANRGVTAPDVNTTTINRGDIRDVDVDDVRAGMLRDTDLDPYMDPYVDNVVQETLRDLEHQYGKAQAGIEGQFAGSNAYGGSRMAVAQTEGARNYGDVVGRTSANLYSAGYQNAQQAAMGDINNALQADMTNQQAAMAEQRYNQAADESVAGMNARFENEMEALRSRLQFDADVQSRGLEMAAGKAMQSGVGIGQNLAYQDAQMMWDMGGAMRGIGQQQADADYASRVAEWNYPLDMINARIAAARGLPYETKTVNETPTGNPYAQGLGLISTAGGIYNEFANW